jgi:SPP1 gp7 family putative phage head morphogenesis protein
MGEPSVLPFTLPRPRGILRRRDGPARLVSGPAGALEIKRRPPGLAARQARHPDHLAGRYRAILLKRVRLTRDLLLTQLDRALDGAAGREIDLFARTDDALTDLIRVVELVQRAVDETLPINEAELQGVAEGVDAFTTAQQAEVFARVAAIDIFTPELATGLYADFTSINVDLIKSIDARFFADIEAAVTDAVRTGRSTAELRKEIQDRYGVSKSRAELIARDQISKFNGQVTEYRQRSVGITRYMWSTSGDERVRDSHKAHDGKIFEWSKPPEDTGHPGMDVGCRCVGIPVVDDADAAQLQAEQAARVEREKAAGQY